MAPLSYLFGYRLSTCSQNPTKRFPVTMWPVQVCAQRYQVMWHDVMWMSVCMKVKEFVDCVHGVCEWMEGRNKNKFYEPQGLKTCNCSEFSC